MYLEPRVTSNNFLGFLYFAITSGVFNTTLSDLDRTLFDLDAS